MVPHSARASASGAGESRRQARPFSPATPPLVTSCTSFRVSGRLRPPWERGASAGLSTRTSTACRRSPAHGRDAAMPEPNQKPATGTRLLGMGFEFAAGQLQL